MTSGLQWNEDEISFSGNNDIMNLRTLSTNFYDYVLNKPVVATPGTIWNYSSGMPILLAGILENATGQPVFDFAKENLLNHIGITDIDWANDPEGHTIGAWGILTSARSYAKLGYLYYKNGIWDGTQILPENWVSETRVAPLIDYPKFGYMFWTAHRYPKDIGTRIPEDTYMAVGLFQKYIIIIPSQNLILVRIGNDYATGEMGWDTAEFISLVVKAIQE
jgi:CubicO group peptidase (beta-lactamase class C family)